MTFFEFLKDVITLLVMHDVPLPINNDVRMDETITRLTGRDFPSIKSASAGAKNLWPTKPCRVCSARHIKTSSGKPIKTVYICAQCPSQPGLHPDKGFEIYHTRMEIGEKDDD